MSQEHFIVCAGLVKIFKVAGSDVVALQGLDLEVRRGEMLALVGPSGSGKSTLLSMLGGLDRPAAGRLEVNNHDLLTLSQVALTEYRRKYVGMLWQQTMRNLLPYLSARNNIELLMTLAGRGRCECRAWANELLDAVGMAEHSHQKPPQLSGGQQQRLALACALANKPQLLLADEPTGEVDWATAQRMLQLVRELRARYQLTIVMVTHDPRVAAQADRVVAIRDGRTSTETSRISDNKQLMIQVERSSAQELVVLDRAGRLQLPSEQRIRAGIYRRARIELVDEGLLVRPGDDDIAGIHAEDGSIETSNYSSLYSVEPRSTTPTLRNQITVGGEDTFETQNNDHPAISTKPS
jgi:peptide/nickel transport system ATP-binding protein